MSLPAEAGGRWEGGTGRPRAPGVLTPRSRVSRWAVTAAAAEARKYSRNMGPEGHVQVAEPPSEVNGKG